MTGPTGQPYDYTFAPRAVRDLEKLPESVAAACVEFIAGVLRENPRGGSANRYCAANGSGCGPPAAAATG